MTVPETTEPVLTDLKELLIATRHSLGDWKYENPCYSVRKAYHRKLNISIGEVELWNDGFFPFMCGFYKSRAVYLHRKGGDRIRVPVDKEVSGTIKWLLDKLDERKAAEHEKGLLRMGAVQ